MINLELPSISVVMRMAVIKSLFGLLARLKGPAVLFKNMFITLKITDSFGVGILQLGCFIKLWLNGYTGFKIELKDVSYFRWVILVLMRLRFN